MYIVQREFYAPVRMTFRTGQEVCKVSTLIVAMLWLLWLPSFLQSIPSQDPKLAQAPLGSSPSAPPQQSASAQTGDVRTVYIAVAEKDGTPIPNLRLEDFSVLENGEPQRIIEVTSAASTPLVVCLLVDSSGSERTNPARRDDLELLSRFLASAITESDKAVIVEFNEDLYRVTKVTNDLAELRAGLRQIAKTPPRGATALYDALLECAKGVPIEPNKRQIVLVLSDFEDNASRNSVERTVPSLQATGTAVFGLVEFDPSVHGYKDRKRGPSAAQRIAKDSGGSAYEVKSPTDVETALNQLQLLLRTSYVVKYHATGKSKKNKLVTLRIEVQRKEAFVFAPQARPPAPQ